MKKLLLPIDGSVRSLRTIEMTKALFSPDQVEITVVTVLPGQMHIDAQLEKGRIAHQAQEELVSFAELLPGYQVKSVLLEGNPGLEIVQYAEKEGFDALCMTRSSRGPLEKMGSVATYIVKNAPFLELHIMKETED